jgi:hypothetical protein
MNARRLLAVVLLLAACEHPIDVVTPHAEVADLVVRDSAGTILARTVDNKQWTGAMPAMVDGMQLRVTVNALDFRDGELSLETRPDLQVRMDAEDPTLVSWEPQRGFGRLAAVAPGSTRVRFLIWHTTHADFVSPWLAITIAPPVSGSRIPQPPVQEVP